MALSRTKRPAIAKAGALEGLALIACLVASGCAAGSGDNGDADAGASGGSGGSSGTGGSSDAGAFDALPGSGGASSGSGGSSASGGATSSGGSTGVGSGGQAGSAAGGASGTAGKGGSAPPMCAVHIEPVAPALLTGIEAGRGAKLVVRGTVNNPTMASYTWTWTVTSNNTTVTPVTKMDDVSSTFEFAIPNPDNFMITARVNDSKCTPGKVQASSVVAKPGFIFRTTASGFPAQEQRIDLAAGLTPTVVLQPGTQYVIRPLQPGQTNVLRAYMRLKGLGSTFSLEGDTTHGPIMANLSSSSLYDLLIVPMDATVAPLLLRNAPTKTFLMGIPVDQGLHVSGVALDSAGSPLADARMLLKQGELPSTVGVSGPNGKLELWARAGTASAIIVPPASSGLPQAAVDLATDGTGVAIPTDTSSFLLTMKWNAVARAALTVSVVGVDGTSPQAGARVHVTLRATANPVGVLTASRSGTPDVSLSAMGTLDVEAISDAAGQARFTSVPVGTYDVTITPPSGQGSAITGVSVMVLATGQSRTVRLLEKVNLTGTLPGGQGASVTALDKSGGATGTAVTAVAGSDGAFTLSVDPNRSYQLIIQPRLAQGLGRAVIASVAVAAGGRSLGSIALPPALTVNGSVTENGSGNPVRGAFVQAFCVSTSATCADPSMSLGEATTLSDGTFKVALPDPTAPPPL